MSENENENEVFHPKYAFYVAVGDLPPAEARAHLNDVRKQWTKTLGKKNSFFIPVRGSDSRVEVLVPSNTSDRGWDLFVALHIERIRNAHAMGEAAPVQDWGEIRSAMRYCYHMAEAYADEESQILREFIENVDEEDQSE